MPDAGGSQAGLPRGCGGAGVSRRHVHPSGPPAHTPCPGACWVLCLFIKIKKKEGNDATSSRVKRHVHKCHRTAREAAPRVTAARASPPPPRPAIVDVVGPGVDRAVGSEAPSAGPSWGTRSAEAGGGPCAPGSLSLRGKRGTLHGTVPPQRGHGRGVWGRGRLQPGGPRGGTAGVLPCRTVSFLLSRSLWSPMSVSTEPDCARTSGRFSSSAPRRSTTDPALPPGALGPGRSPAWGPSEGRRTLLARCPSQ